MSSQCWWTTLSLGKSFRGVRSSYYYNQEVIIIILIPYTNMMYMTFKNRCGERKKSMTTTRTTNTWPEFALASGKTPTILHRTRIVGKIRLPQWSLVEFYSMLPDMEWQDRRLIIRDRLRFHFSPPTLYRWIILPRFSHRLQLLSFTKIWQPWDHLEYRQY